jgi:hypothetical protein
MQEKAAQVNPLGQISPYRFDQRAQRKTATRTLGGGLGLKILNICRLIDLS